MVTDDDHDNNLVAAGALYALLSGLTESHIYHLTAVEVVFDAGYPTNQVDVTFSFMASPYRLTVERVSEADEDD
jgi:hypothetical protein